MSKKNGVASAPQTQGEPQASCERTRSAEIAACGLSRASDVIRLGSALASDLLNGNVDPRMSNATMNVVGKMLKSAELQCRFGRPDTHGNKDLLLSGDAIASDDAISRETERQARIDVLHAELRQLGAV